MPQPQEADDGEFTFPTPPPPQLLNGHYRYNSRVSPSSPSPAWLLSSPIRRSFSAADCAASPWRATRGACRSPTLSDYAGEFEEEEEELMDSLWEDLNDDEAPSGGKNDPLVASLDVWRRRSVCGPGGPLEKSMPTAATKEREAAGAVLAASRSSRRRSPGLVVMMRAVKKMFVAHKSRSRVHKVDDQSTASASSSGNSFKK
uniref:Uncharacterized protein n=1 Tax=Avena sativa TaxID=4498 RepID=A0ACD5WWU9_AVESA